MNKIIFVNVNNFQNHFSHLVRGFKSRDPFFQGSLFFSVAIGARKKGINRRIPVVSFVYIIHLLRKDQEVCLHSFYFLTIYYYFRERCSVTRSQYEEVCFFLISDFCVSNTKTTPYIHQISTF